MTGKKSLNRSESAAATAVRAHQHIQTVVLPMGSHILSQLLKLSLRPDISTTLQKIVNSTTSNTGAKDAI